MVHPKCHSINKCLRWSLNCSFNTTSNTCHCEVILLGITTMSTYTELTAAVILVLSDPVHPMPFSHFLRRAPSCLFHTTDSQYFISSAVMLPLGWHMTIIPLRNCSLGAVLWFKIMYNGNLPPSANMSTLMLLTSCNYLIFSSAQLLPHQLQNYCMAYWSPLMFCWHFLFGSWCNFSSCQVRSHVLLSSFMFRAPSIYLGCTAAWWLILSAL